MISLKERISVVKFTVSVSMLYLMFCHCDGLLIHVCSTEQESAKNCSLDYYSRHIPLENNTFILLEEGIHQILINESIHFNNLRNLSIIGSSRLKGYASPYTTTIKCVGSSGFLFSKIQGLYVSGFAMINCGRASVYKDVTSGGALVMIETSDVVVENVIVTNSKWYGMYGSNMQGYSRIHSSIFSSNFAPHINRQGGNVLLSWSPHNISSSENDTLSNTDDTIHFFIDESKFVNGHSGGNKAGGLYVDYQQFCKTSHIVISNSTFQGNNGGNIQVVVEEGNQNQRCPSLFTLELVKVDILDGSGSREAGAGGMSFSLKDDGSSANIFYHLSQYYISVKDSIFIRNSNNYLSGGFYLDTTKMRSDKFSLEFVNVSFVNNSGLTGGAVAAYLTTTERMQTFFTLSSCLFEGNSAPLGGAIYSTVKTFQSEYKTLVNHSGTVPVQFTVMGCVLQDNVAFQNGSALVISSPLTKPTSVKLLMNNSVIQRNKIMHLSNNDLLPTHATIVIENCLAVIENDKFLSNVGSAIGAVNSELHFSGDVVFESNSAVYGGGLQLSRAKLHLSDGTNVIFKNNHAYEYGGAVYIADNSLKQSTKTEECFVTNSDSSTSPGKLPQMTFLDNSAARSNSMMSAIFYGPMNACFLDNHTLFVFQDEVDKPMPLSVPLNVKICKCYANYTLNCNQNSFSVDVYSGRQFSLKMAVLDYSGKIIPSVISTRLQNESIGNTTVFTGGLQMTQMYCTDLKYTLSSYNSYETLTLTVIDYAVVHSLDYLVHILPCPLGFSVQGNSPACQCVPELIRQGITCNINDQTFEHNGKVWIGSASSELSNDTDSEENHFLCGSKCPLGYCKLNPAKITLEDADKQCISNHSGILCGGCLPGLSTSLGHSNCINCEATSKLHTALFLFLFSALALVLVAFLRLCNLTISQGSASPVIFYANVIHVNGTFFFERRETNPLTIFLSWFNLDFGFESCFYNGMDATAKAWLQFIFPLYLWVVIVVIYIASKKSAKFVRLMGRQCHSVVLTLLHLSFFKLCRSTIAVLLYTDLQNENGEHIRVWRYNGNIHYYSKKHAPLLAFASIILVCFIIPYMIIMICTPLIVRKGYQVRCMNFWKLKPLFDAYTGLYKDRAMFWNGLTTIIYTILLVTSTEVEVMLNLVIIALTSLILVFLNFSFGGIYRQWTLSIVEATIHSNLICLSILSLLYVTQSQSVSAAAYSSVAVSFVIFIGVLIVQGMKELSRVSKTIRKLIHTVSHWCHSISGGCLASNKYHRCQKCDSECSQSEKHPFTLDYYLLNVDSTGRYYDTGHRDHILTSVQDEEEPENIPLVSTPTAQSAAEPPVIDHSKVLPNAITVSVVTLEDAEEETETEDLDDDRNEERVCCLANQTTNTNSIQSRSSFDSEDRIPEVCINIDEKAPLLTPSIESPQSVHNYLTFEHPETTPLLNKLSPCQKVSFKPSFKLKNLQKGNKYYALDSDTDATGQRPSNHIDVSKQPPLEYLQRTTDSLELAVVDEFEGDSDEDMSVVPKIYQQCKKGPLPPKTNYTKGIRSYFESLMGGQPPSEDDESIHFLSLNKVKHERPLELDLTNPMRETNCSSEDISSQEEEYVRVDHRQNPFVNHSTDLGSSSIRHHNDFLLESITSVHAEMQTIGSQMAESVPFLDPIELIPVTSKGVVYTSEKYGVSVKIPEGALPSWLCSMLEVGIAPHGPFEFPAGMMPISPILWVCMQHESLLLKPVEIIMPHCLTDLTEDDPIKGDIGFLKASHSSDYTINSNGRRVFQFRKAEGEINFTSDSTSAILTTKHFCFQCLKVNVSPESARKRGFCLIYGIPKPWPKSSTIDISIGITYFLQTCIETFKRQIKDLDVDYNFNFKQFHFKDPSQPVKLVIKPIHEWIMIIQEGEEGITMDEVDFWNKDEALLETMVDNNAYPPRFVLSVYKNGARNSAVAKLQFEGTLKCEKINIILQHITHSSFQRKLNSEGSESSMSSMQQMDVIASDLESVGEDVVLCREPDLADFMNRVAKKIPGRWKQLGIQLRFQLSDLDQIEEELMHEPSMNRSEAAFMKLFTKWKKVRPSAFAWATLIAALRARAMDEQVLAHELCSMLSGWYA